MWLASRRHLLKSRTLFFQSKSERLLCHGLIALTSEQYPSYSIWDLSSIEHWAKSRPVDSTGRKSSTLQMQWPMIFAQFGFDNARNWFCYFCSHFVYNLGLHWHESIHGAWLRCRKQTWPLAGEHSPLPSSFQTVSFNDIFMWNCIMYILCIYIYICWSSRLPEGLVTLCLTPICWDTEQSVQLDRLSSPERHGKQRLPAVQTFVTFVSSLSTATPSASIEASRHRGIDSQGHPRQCGDVKLEALTGKSLKTKPE